MALTKWQRPMLRHDAASDDERVTWLELFFDLIYVAAFIQLGDRLSDDTSWGGVVTFAGIFTVLWWTWTGTTAFVNRFAADDLVHRMLVFAQMFAVGNFALVAVAPVDDRSTWLAVAYVAARMPLVAMYARVVPIGGSTARLAKLYLAAFLVGAALWLLSLLFPPPARYALWAVALAIEFLAPIVAMSKESPPPIHAEHFRERYAIFTIIVLGETFVKTLTELAEVGLSLQSQVYGAVGFAIGIALWWTYFDDIADSGRRRDIGRLRIGWVYAHLPLAAALTAFGVAAKKIVTIPSFGAEIRATYLWLLGGSIAVALSAAAFLAALTVSPHFAVDRRERVIPRLVAAVAVLAIAAVVRSPALLATGLIAAVVIGQIALEVTIALRADRLVHDAVTEQISATEGSCEHLDRGDRRRSEADRCVECLEHGMNWVELRECLQCGHVGCCDDSPGRHARGHWEDTTHPVILSADPDEDWAYCFVDDVAAVDWSIEPTQTKDAGV